MELAWLASRWRARVNRESPAVAARSRSASAVARLSGALRTPGGVSRGAEKSGRTSIFSRAQGGSPALKRRRICASMKRRRVAQTGESTRMLMIPELQPTTTAWVWNSVGRISHSSAVRRRTVWQRTTMAGSRNRSSGRMFQPGKILPMYGGVIYDLTPKALTIAS